MLRSSFAGHPNIVARTELFNPDWNHNEPFDDSVPAEVVLREHVFRDYPQRVKAIGFVLHRSGARFGNWPDLWELLQADADLHVISLRRDNLLRRYISFHLMRERIRSGRGAQFVPARRAYRPEELQGEFERAERELAAFDVRFAAHPVLRLSYEQLCSDYAAVMRRIHVFLGVEPRAVRPTTSRDVSLPLDELIVNWDELGLAFAPTRWAWYFRRTLAPALLSARAQVTVTW